MPKRKALELAPVPQFKTEIVEFTPSPALQEAMDAPLSDEEVRATADALFSGVDPHASSVHALETVTAPSVLAAPAEPWERVKKGDTGIYTDHNGIGHIATVDEVLTSTGGEIRVNLSVPTLNPPRMSGVIVVADSEPDTWYNPPYAGGEGPDRWSAA